MQFLKTVACFLLRAQKWHLGQRPMYLPAARGFDYYLGIPFRYAQPIIAFLTKHISCANFSDDMGAGRRSNCNSTLSSTVEAVRDRSIGKALQIERDVSNEVVGSASAHARWEDYRAAGYTDPSDPAGLTAAPGELLPLMHQRPGGGSGRRNGNVNYTTSVLEQPVDLTTLAPQYRRYLDDFVAAHAHSPFFLYVPFSHVHTTENNQPHIQYAGCLFRNTSRRGPFGDAISEADWLVGALVAALQKAGVENNTLTIFTGRQ